MKRFVWVLKADTEPFLSGAGGVSASYILPRSYSPSESSDLAGAQVWMVLRGERGDVLFACTCIILVEQFKEDLNAGDYLLTTSLIDSFRCCVSYSSGIANYLVNETNNFPLGLNEVDAELFETLSSTINVTPTNLRKPDRHLLDRITKSLSNPDFDCNAEFLLIAAICNLALEEVWASVSPKLPPFANFAYHAILQMRGKDFADSIIDELSRQDPTVALATKSKHVDCRDIASNETNEGCDCANVPVVDVTLLPIDPDRVFARKFIAHWNADHLMDAIKKTEHAEQRHQDMLRDLAKRLIDIGFLPKQSSSIDLFVETKNGGICFELKSSTRQNIFQQTAKGIFQLGCYKIALWAKGLRNVKLVLVIETTGIDELNVYVGNVVNMFGLCVLFYSIEQPWPDRLLGLEDVLKNV